MPFPSPQKSAKDRQSWIPWIVGNRGNVGNGGNIGNGGIMCKTKVEDQSENPKQKSKLDQTYLQGKKSQK